MPALRETIAIGAEGGIFTFGINATGVSLNLVHVSNDENKMADRSKKNKEVPDTMRVNKISGMVEDIKNHTQGVDQAASGKPIKACIGKFSFKAGKVESTGPTHSQIN